MNDNQILITFYSHFTMPHILTDNLNRISTLCQKHNVKSLYAFGSVLTNRFNEDSDIDLVVNFNDAEIKDAFVNFFDFHEALENIFARRVDLVDYSAISNNSFRLEVNRTRQLIYG